MVSCYFIYKRLKDRKTQCVDKTKTAVLPDMTITTRLTMQGLLLRFLVPLLTLTRAVRGSGGGGAIVGGEEAAPGEFPHQVALLRGGLGGSLMCGGSLIAADKVVTVGYCCDG